MQLVRLQFTNFRRFKSGDASLHGRLIALVGPNEAGKSSLLDALQHLNTNDRIPRSVLTSVGRRVLAELHTRILAALT